ncbi:MAG: hrpB [Acidobacteria bacterium]|nr:hrpB [Acidobacteriota bacterium]
MSLIPLPIDPLLGEIVDRVRRSRAAVITAAPGAGKTTRVPPALLGDGPVILLQPRRVAARAIAARIAAERGWTLGREVGWQIRFERRFAADTRLLVVTEGILTARLQTDPLLSEFTTIVLDEFHERSVHADLAIALARQAWRARNDLRIVVMSATLDAQPVSAFLDDCPVIDVAGRSHPINVSYHPGESVADAAAALLAATTGQVLCFLPGAAEIRRAVAELQYRTGSGVEVVPLHGSLDAGEQDLALRPSSGRRVIVATNIAETSLTVPGVTAVVDAGLQKTARYDAERGIDSLETERITQDAADQRAGRAGRVSRGVVRRLWDARDRLRPHREPEIHRVDLASTALDVIAWGGDPRTFAWFERPREEALDAALALLDRLGLTHAGRLTPIGEQVRRLPLHPRLARMLVAADGARPIAQACALLSERHLLPPRSATTTSDLLSALDRWAEVPPHVKRVADVIADLGMRIADPGMRTADFGMQIADQSAIQSAVRTPQSAITETAFLRAVLAAYPDRVAQRREPGSPTVLLASGTGATMAPESGVRNGEFLVALDVRQSPQGARVGMASLVEREWLRPTGSELVHRFDADVGKVRASRVDRYDALVLAERSAPVDPEIAARLLADAWLARRQPEPDVALLRRLRFTGQDVDLETLVRAAAYGARTLDEVRLDRVLAPELVAALARDAPETLHVPSGRHVPLVYHDDGSVTAAVKLQELFGLAETPRVGRQREAVVLSLLAPNGRPVQVTRDLRSFWDRTYPEVRKELRGRYPKHPWPEDPWTAPPTARTKRSKY